MRPLEEAMKKSRTVYWAALSLAIGVAVGLSIPSASGGNWSTYDKWELQDIELTRARGSISDWKYGKKWGQWVYAGTFGPDDELLGTSWVLHPPLEFIGQAFGRDALKACADWIDQRPEIGMDPERSAACDAEIVPCMNLHLTNDGYAVLRVDGTCLRQKQQERVWHPYYQRPDSVFVTDPREPELVVPEPSPRPEGQPHP